MLSQPTLVERLFSRFDWPFDTLIFFCYFKKKNCLLLSVQVAALLSALESPNIPPEILQALLNLAEYMEHDDKALPIGKKML